MGVIDVINSLVSLAIEGCDGVHYKEKMEEM